ncbi:hypothetical protein [Allonocardiopsis opalescens]|uniref:Uncharacterized protein n=1 Tax=Allonocardiopsis opalescens TaxID=1144618 RepID=A0A2T0QCE0_9ACTN|nr:hypothetical protein [Allonocardiopsis opalescens]PRY01541.1 hypothetical protein CLV72_101123 [Allonocardiopsis opalescens]
MSRRANRSAAALTREELAEWLRAAWDEPDRLHDLIVAALDEGRATEVREAARRLTEIDPEPARSAAVLALVKRTCADHQGAERVLLDHIRAHGGSAGIWFSLAPLAAWRGSENDVGTALGNALKYDPDHWETLHWGYRHYLRHGGAQAALDWLERYKARSWRAHLMIGTVLLDRGDREDAFACFEAACELAPNHPGPLSGVAEALLGAGLLAELADVVLRRWRGVHGPVPLIHAIEADLRLGRAADAALALSRLRGLRVPPETAGQVAELERRVRAACAAAGL